jgi:hypothetical protein
MVSSKLFAVSALLGLMATLPVKSAQIQVTVGGPGGITQFSPSSVVGCQYSVLFLPLDDRSCLECQRWRHR